MRRIAIDARTIIHNERSGVWVYTERLIEALSEIDQQNSYKLLFSGIKLKKDSIKLNGGDRFEKVIIPVPDRNFYKKIFLWNSVILPLVFKKKKIDIFHLPAGHHLPSYKKVKKILTVHDLRTLHINDVLPQDIDALKKSCLSSDFIITVSEHTRQDIIGFFGIKSDKVKAIHLGVDRDFEEPKNISEVEDFKTRNNLNKPFFFSLGLMPRKNINRLLSAYSKFKYRNDFLLILGGPGAHGWWYREYKDTISRNKWAENVCLLGNIKQDDLIKLYQASFCFVFPSLYEGFGLPILEAMACGTPVISSDAAALPEVGADAALYVNPYEESDITRKMEIVAENQQLRYDLIARGLIHSKQFTWKKTAREVLAIYQMH